VLLIVVFIWFICCVVMVFSFEMCRLRLCSVLRLCRIEWLFFMLVMLCMRVCRYLGVLLLVVMVEVWFMSGMLGLGWM